MLPPPSCPGPPVGGGLCPAPLGKGSVSHRFPLLRNAPVPRRGGPMCPPGHASSRDPFTGRHTGRPLRSRSKYPSTPEERAGTEPRPYRSIAVPSSGPMYLRHGFRRPNFVPKFGASVIGIGPYERRGSPIDHPGQRRRAERLPRGWEGMGRNRRKDHPKRGTAAATSRAALSEAESAERVAGQIQVLPDDLFVQHGVPGSVAC